MYVYLHSITISTKDFPGARNDSTHVCYSGLQSSVKTLVTRMCENENKAQVFDTAANICRLFDSPPRPPPPPSPALTYPREYVRAGATAGEVRGWRGGPPLHPLTSPAVAPARTYSLLNILVLCFAASHAAATCISPNLNPPTAEYPPCTRNQPPS